MVVVVVVEVVDVGIKLVVEEAGLVDDAEELITAGLDTIELAELDNWFSKWLLRSNINWSKSYWLFALLELCVDVCIATWSFIDDDDKICNNLCKSDSRSNETEFCDDWSTEYLWANWFTLRTFCFKLKNFCCICDNSGSINRNCCWIFDITKDWDSQLTI